MEKAQRVQLKRERGWRMPANTIKVDRTTRFGNPFNAGDFGQDQAIQLHRLWITGELSDEEIREKYAPIIAHHLISRRKVVQTSLSELRGKNLACWCSLDEPCHADTLMELAQTLPLLRNVG